MLSDWLRRRRRRRILARPLPEAWEAHIATQRFFARLAPDEQRRLRELVQVFVAEKRWEGGAGLVVTDEMKVVIAARACRLILNLDHAYYQFVRTILVHPGAYRPRGVGLGGMTYDRGDQALAGETTRRGPVVLSWTSIVSDATQVGRDVVLHEFAHKLDLLDGYGDAAPPLRSREQVDAWRAILTREFETLASRCETGKPTLLDCYGATNPAEFFAVATEVFFEQPRDLRRKHEGLYERLKAFYLQDPAAKS